MELTLTNDDGIVLAEWYIPHKSDALCPEALGTNAIEVCQAIDAIDTMNIFDDKEAFLECREEYISEGGK